MKNAKKKGRVVAARLPKAKRPRKLHVRLARWERRDQLLDEAARSIVEQGFLPLPLEPLARRAKVSKALIYAYFPTQHDLFNALLVREMGALRAAGLVEASMLKTLEDTAVGCVMIYFDHVARKGPLLHILLSDLYMSGRIDRETLRARDAIVRRVARLARAELKLPAKEIIAVVNMVLALPEEAGTLLFTQEADAGVVREMCRTLTLSALKGLASAGRQAGSGAP